MDPEDRTREAVEQHWLASERGDTQAEHAIYDEDAVLDYPQSGETDPARLTRAALCRSERSA
jgi:hypothetical protein